MLVVSIFAVGYGRRRGRLERIMEKKDKIGLSFKTVLGPVAVVLMAEIGRAHV